MVSKIRVKADRRRVDGGVDHHRRRSPRPAGVEFESSTMTDLVEVGSGEETQNLLAGCGELRMRVERLAQEDEGPLSSN